MDFESNIDKKVRTLRGLLSDYTVPKEITNEVEKLVDMTEQIAAESWKYKERFEDTRKHLIELQTLYTVSSALVDKEDLDTMLHTIVSKIAEALPAEYVVVITIDNQAEEIIDTVFNDKANALIQAPSYDELKSGLTGYVIENTQAVLSPKDRPDPRESETVQNRRKENNLGSIIVAPLIYRTNVIGTLTVMNSIEQPDFSFKDLSLVNALANQASIAIENARLYQQAQDELKQRRAVEEKLRRLATHDSLTGIPNRRLFEEKLKDAVARSNRTSKPIAVFYMDLDGFKAVNDTYGHDHGDELLKAVVQRIDKCLRETDTLARVGGDEFAAVLENLKVPENSDIVATRILDSLRTPFAIFGKNCTIGVSIGICVYPTHEGDANRITERADAAMYEAKRKGKNTFQYCGITVSP